MKRKIITIENGLVSVPQSGEVRMTASEIAALFEVYVQTVYTNIKAVLKLGIVKTDVSCAVIVTGNTLMPDEYGLDMITALAFRLHSSKTEIFREWVIHRITAKPSQTLVIPLSKSFLYN
ncbi:MAG: helix-turn-helix domain-containing protein [Dysgonamonadaceae bacterium]|jgi:hypothetical protein|nr:helix-turn-helix domain-containing protein [Dysgonamonadaceae bacterium]